MKLFLLSFSLRVLIGLSIGLSISLTPVSSVNAQEIYQIDDIQVLAKGHTRPFCDRFF
jgi:hypothetical protein